MLKRSIVVTLGLLVLAGCGQNEPASVSSSEEKIIDAAGHVAPSADTIKANKAFEKEIDLTNLDDFELATRGFVATIDPLDIKRADGKVVWTQEPFSFLDGERPDTVNPSLWRQEKLNSIHGLFKVKDGIYQVRGYDLGNMSLIEGDTGWIIIDPLTVTETAAAALALANDQLGARPVKAVLFSHSHIDHFGGVMGVVTQEEIESGAVRIIAPEGFFEEAVSENVIAGAVMGRRATYMTGGTLDKTASGHVGTGLGKGIPFGGTYTIAMPTDVVTTTGTEITVDGVRMVFQNTHGSEAPAEFMIHFPDHKAFCGAEVISRNMHNIYTLRGAKVRDALKWSGYIDEAIELFGSETDIIFNSHHWPVFGQAESVGYLKRQRDTYKFIHDQTIRLASSGMTPREISEVLEMPESLASDFATRGYYGTVSHNSKAVYQFYFGWYDGNPANLNPLPPEVEGARYVDAMGGADAVMEKANAAYSNGDYRWAATLLNNLVFADGTHDAARVLLAETYDQLGYRAESGPWRDNYLTGASELRHGPTGAAIDISSNEIVPNIPLDQFFNAIAVRIDAEKAEGKTIKLNFVFSDVGETHVVALENSVMNHWQREADADVDATVTLTRGFWLKVLSGQVGIRELVFSDEISIDGSELKVISFLTALDRGIPNFPIVTP